MAELKDLNGLFNNFVFLNIFKTFRIAIQPARFITAFLALSIVFIAGWLMDFTRTVVVSGKITTQQLRTIEMTGIGSWPTELHCFVVDSQRVNDFIKNYKGRAEGMGVFKVWSNFCLAQFNRAATSLVLLNFNEVIVCVTSCLAACLWAIKYHTVYSVVFLLITMIMFSIAGGAICRGAALHFSKDERVGITRCLRFAIRKFISLFFAPLAPLVLIFGFGVAMLAFGLLTNIPYAGEIITALFIVIVIVAGVFMALAAIGLAGGANLMYPAIAYENTDAFDAVSRSFSYVYARPWRLTFYTLLAAFYGSICYLFVRFFAYVCIGLSRYFLSLAIWTDGSRSPQLNKLDVIWPEPEFFNLLGASVEISRNATEAFAAFLIHLAVLVVSGLVIAFAISFYFSASSVIYCLLRKKVDNVELDNVFVEAE